MLIMTIEETMTTPPLSSSPAPAMDYMEMSPLPHKAPFNISEAELRTPTIEVSCMDTPMGSTDASPLQDSPLVAQKDGQHE
jgi:M-phase inducer tyrosine phosphatase